MILEGITLQLKDHWLCKVSQQFPERKLELVDFHPAVGGNWRGILKTPVDGSVHHVVEWMQKELKDVVLLRCENKTCLHDCDRNASCSLAFTCKEPPFAKTLLAHNVFLQLPVILQDSTLYMRVASTDEHLKEFYLELLELKNCQVHIIKKFRHEELGKSYLTEKQEKFLRIAIEQGYYAVPRKITTQELAERLGIAQSTLGEHLRKAELCIISSYTL